MISDQELLQAVKDETSGEFEVYGELGRDKSGRVGLLAREHATNSLVVLVVSATSGANGEDEFSLELITELDNRVPDKGTFCVSCGTRLRPWGRFCQNCGLDALGRVGTADMNPDEMRAAVEESISGDYELLGEMRRKEGGGRVYFARDAKDGHIAALRLTRGLTDGELELGETRVLRRSGDEADVSVSVTQLLRPLNTSAGSGSRRNGAAPRSSPRPSAPPGTKATPKPQTRPSPDAASGSRPAIPDTRTTTGQHKVFTEWTPKTQRKALIAAGLCTLLAALGWLAVSG